jgi:hypothetical protein
LTSLDWVQIAVGAIIVLGAFYDLFQAVILPRPAVNKTGLTRYLLKTEWRVWRWVGLRSSDLAWRERWLAAFGPLGVLSMFAGWLVSVGFGYGLIFHGVRAQLRPVPEDLGSSMYFSATTLAPLSYGDVIPVGTAARIVTVAESATGVLLAALVITLLFSLYSSFQEREELVVCLDAMAGAPPAGVQILETARERGMRQELIRTFDDWQRWASAVLESHLAYPTLFYFRSSHDNEAWIHSFGAVMDAAVLVMSTLDDDAVGPARLMFTVGNHLVEDMSWIFRLQGSEYPYIEREEFDQVVERLVKAGYPCRPGDVAWDAFVRLRAKYAFPLNQMADRLAIIPTLWMGDRSYLPHQRGTRARRRRVLSSRARGARE